ncbi:hypothetical protein FA13DRAFT_78718 [Coprinellus micaceus]|uniref:Uncharacterized protein n=1 Tax=Coprinellus micaceus TaxID=71717 RepID=A0A4Y7TJZ1_COPMI|nr:hypothetical protein FA13DRAFT_78718 [Coprinellus micaceus]
MTTTNSDSSDSPQGPPPFVILDDTSELRVGDGWSQLHDVENAYNRTLSSLNTKPDRAIDNRVSIRFRGTGLRLVGRATTNLKMNYTIHSDPGGDAERESETFPVEWNVSTTVVGQDGLAPFIWSLNDILPFRDNVVTIAPHEGELQLDYVAFMPASHQVNRRDVILVDNTHPYIQYKNGEDAAGFTLVGNISSTAGLPFGGTWMRTSQTGSSFETKFRGSKVAVYGALHYAVGRLRVRYSLESGSPAVIHHFDSTHKANGTKWTMERLFAHTFSAEDARNNHRLRVTILECTGDQVPYLSPTGCSPP